MGKKSNIYDGLIGKRFYRNIDDSIEVIRILKVIHSNKIIAYDESKGMDTTFTLTHDDLTTYRALVPDLLYSISIIKTSPITKSKDVIISVMRRQDMKKEYPVPYVIGRQMISSPINSTTIGLGADVFDPEHNVQEFSKFMTCHSIEVTIMINSYLDDNYDTVSRLVPKGTSAMFNRIMKNNMNEFKKSAYKFNKDLTVEGVSSVKDLFNMIAQSVDDSVGIISVSDINNHEDIANEIFTHSSIEGKIKLDHIIPYKKDINLDLIKIPYSLCRDANTSIVYLVTYTNL